MKKRNKHSSLTIGIIQVHFKGPAFRRKERENKGEKGVRLTCVNIIRSALAFMILLR